MTNPRIPAALGALMVLACALAACVPEPPAAEPLPSTEPVTEQVADDETPAEPTPTPTPTPDAATVYFVSVIDGDTVETSAGTVRIIGIDTPERGECGHGDASAALGRLVANGEPVTLELPAGQNDVDRYGRLLRYVETESGVDLGLAQLEAGNAIARYDLRDGYPEHPREEAYHAAQTATRAADGSVLILSCAMPSPVPSPPQQAVPAPPADTPWWQQYSSCTKLKKNTVGHPKGPFRVDDPDEVEIYNWFAYGTGNRGDGDGDGLACE